MAQEKVKRPGGPLGILCSEVPRLLIILVILSIILQLELQIKDMEEQEDTEGMEGIIIRL